MANLSFSTFMEQHLPVLQKDPNFAEYVKVAHILIKKYNRKIFLSAYENSIKNNNEGIRDFISFLIKYGFWDKKYLGLLAKKIKSQTNTLDFTIQTPISSQKNIHSKVDAILKKDFAEYNLQDDENSHLGITIKGNGYQYKRNLDSDLDLLLK